jgi:hypothetical protein
MAAAPAMLRLLRPLLLTIASEQAWFEIDPDHAEEGESVDANTGNLERACQWFLDTILVSLKDIPHACRHLLAAVASCFADQGLKIMCQAASLCFFCQLVIPCILSPLSAVSSGLDDEISLTGRSRRALVYIAEAIRAVASSAPFDTNTPGRSKCMGVINSFIIRNAPRTLVAFENVISLPTPSTPRTSALNECSCNAHENDDMLLVSTVLAKRRVFIESWLVSQGLDEDLELLLELSSGYKEAMVGDGDALAAFTQSQHESMFPELPTAHSPASPPRHSASAAAQALATHFQVTAAHNQEHDATEQPQDLLVSTSLSHAGSDVCPSEDSAVSNASASVAASAAAAALSSAAVAAASGSFSVFRDDGSTRMTGMASAEHASLSPVSFLIQSHTGVLPPTSPISRPPQTPPHVLQQRSSFEAARAVSLQQHAPRVAEHQVIAGACIGAAGIDVEAQQRSETEELEILLQRQLLTEQLQYQQQHQSQSNRQQQLMTCDGKDGPSTERHVSRATSLAPDPSNTHQQQLDLEDHISESDHHPYAPHQDPLSNNRIRRIPLSPSLTPPIMAQSNVAYPEVIRPQATRLSSRLHGSTEESPLGGTLLQRQYIDPSTSGQSISPKPPQLAHYVSAAPASFEHAHGSHLNQPLAGIGVTLKRNSLSNICVRRVCNGGHSHGALLQCAACANAP